MLMILPNVNKSLCRALSANHIKDEVNYLIKMFNCFSRDKEHCIISLFLAVYSTCSSFDFPEIDIV